jgi:hypothetical protein
MNKYRISKTFLDYLEFFGYVPCSDETDSWGAAYKEMRRQDDINYSTARHVVPYPDSPICLIDLAAVAMMKGRDDDPPDA